VTISAQPPGLMADNALEDQADLDTVFTDLVRVETRLYNAVAEHVKAEAGVGAGHFELLRYVRGHPGARRWSAEQLFPAFQPLGMTDVASDMEFTEYDADELYIR